MGYDMTHQGILVGKQTGSDKPDGKGMKMGCRGSFGMSAGICSHLSPLLFTGDQTTELLMAITRRSGSRNYRTA